MSGPSCHTGCPGPIPDVRPILPVELLWFCILVVIAPDVRDFPGCPGLPVTPDVRAPFRISGHRYPENVFMLRCAPDVRPPAGCPGLPVLPDVRAWPRMSGPSVLSSGSVFCSSYLARPDVRPLARMSGLLVLLHYNGHIHAHAIYTPCSPQERVDHSL